MSIESISEVTVINVTLRKDIYGSHDKPANEIIIDFSNGWHHSIRIGKGISVDELVDSLHNFAKIIDNNPALK